MRTLTKEAERKLIAAIEKAASLVNDGMAPNAAIIKSAGDANIPAGHINLVVHAYNTGRTTKQRESGESTLEKAADFNLADTDTVLKALYPEQVKTSAAIARNEVVSTEYAVSPSGFLARRRDAMQKAASAAVSLPEKTWTPPPRDEHAAVMRAQSEKNAALRAAEETRRQAAAAYQKAANSLDELNIYFRTPGNMPFGDALREVGLRLGPSGVSVLQKVAAVYPQFTKQADTGKNHYGQDPLYRLVEDVIGTVELYNDAQSKVPSKKAEAVGRKTAPNFLTGSILYEPADEPLTLKEAGGLDANVRRVVENQKMREPYLEGGLMPTDPFAGQTSFDGRDFSGPSPRTLVSTKAIDRGLDRSEAAKAREERSIEDIVNENMADDPVYGPEGPTPEQAAEIAAKREELARGREAFNTPVPNVLSDLLAVSKKPLGNLAGKGLNAATGFSGGLNSAMKNMNIGVTTPVKVVGGLIGASQEGVSGQIGKILGGDDKNDKTKQHFQALTDSDHEQALKTIRAKGVLHDLVINDPVISGYDPHDVAMAFNEVAELAPNLVDSPGMIQSVLRKRLEAGSLADFDVKQILEMDKLRADRDKTLAETRDIRTNRLM
jgi:hypothetical protein